jgi:hypothetical protein
VIAAAAARVLLNTVALTVIQEPRLAGKARRRILPGGEPSLGVIRE